MDTTILTDPWIWVWNNALSDDFCDHLIDKFEKEAASGGENSLVRKGRTIGDTYGSEDLTGHRIKQSDDFAISDSEEWRDEDNFLHKTLTQMLNAYQEYTSNTIILPHTPIGFVETSPQRVDLVKHVGSYKADVTDTGFQMQRTQPHHGYGWHTDFWATNENGIRILTFIFYLNTVREGWTQFYNGNQVQPHKGRVMLFPATATYYHQGYPPLDTKYIITGWLHKELDNDYGVVKNQPVRTEQGFTIK